METEVISLKVFSLEEVNVKGWPRSLKNLLKKYPDTLIVIPGHGRWGHVNLIHHKLTLFHGNTRVMEE